MTGGTLRARSAINHLPALVLGVLMTVLSVSGTHWTNSAVALLSGAAVLVAIRFRWAAAAAVCLSAVNLAVATPPAVQTAVAGVCAAAFLATTYSTTSPRPVAAGFAVGFTMTAAAATSLPLDIAWMPMAAPFVLLAAFSSMAIPYTRQRDSG